MPTFGIFRNAGSNSFVADFMTSQTLRTFSWSSPDGSGMESALTTCGKYELLAVLTRRRMFSLHSSFPSGPNHGRDPKQGSLRPYVALSFAEAPHAQTIRMSLKSPVGPSSKVSDGAGQRSVAASACEAWTNAIQWNSSMCPRLHADTKRTGTHSNLFDRSHWCQ
jgi:hypothetical protein